MGLEPTGLLHLTRFPGELLSHSVNPPRRGYMQNVSKALIYTIIPKA